MEKLLLWMTILLVSSAPFISHSQAPLKHSVLQNTPAIVQLPPVDNIQLQNQEIENRAQGRPARFAHAFDVNLNPNTHGTWSEIENNQWKWELEIHSDKAHSLNLGFSEFVLTGDAQFKIYAVDTKQLLGNYTASDNDLHKQLFTPILPTDKVQLELIVSQRFQTLQRLHLTTVNHAFRPLIQKNTLNDCHIDVICDAANGLDIIDDFRNEIRSVGLITIDGMSICTGVLVNNTNQDFTPYFLTAEHCGIDATNAASVVVYWRFENSVCRSDSTMTVSINGDGVLNSSNSGAELMASYNPSDMTLLRLDDPLPASATAYFAGWDARGQIPEQGTCIHHPAGEEKRISFDFDTLQRSLHFMEPSEEGDHWRVQSWELGSTDGGSSGAPLFDQNNRIIGQLHGGSASCGEEGSDWYGAFDISWKGGGKPDSQLRHWLDPVETNITFINGLSLNNEVPLTANAIVVQELSCDSDSTAQIMVEVSGGESPYLYSIDGEHFQESPLFDSLGVDEYMILVIDAKQSETTTNLLNITAPVQLQLEAEVILNDIFLQVIGGQEPFLFSLDSIAFQETNIFRIIEKGTYEFFVLDANECLSSILVDVFWEDMEVGFRMLEDLNCAGDSDAAFEIVIEGGIAPYGIFLDTLFFAESMFTDQAAGTYDFMILDSVLDTVYFPITIYEPLPLTVEAMSVEDRIVVDAFGGTGMLSYSLDSLNFQTSNQFENLDNGAYTVYVLDENGCIAMDTSSINLVSISNIQEIEIKLFPNPTKDQLQISNIDSSLPINEIRIYNCNGKRIRTYLSNSNSRITLDLSTIPQGIYLIEIRGESYLFTERLVKY